MSLFPSESVFELERAAVERYAKNGWIKPVSPPSEQDRPQGLPPRVAARPGPNLEHMAHDLQTVAILLDSSHPDDTSRARRLVEDLLDEINRNLRG